MSIQRIGDIVLIQLSDIDSNIYVIGDTVIDSGTGFNFTKLYSLLKMLNIKLEDVKHVINTHGHFDHVGGNGYFLNASISIHEEDAPILENGDLKVSMADFFNGKLKPRHVDRKLRDEDGIRIGSMDCKVIHTPGHSPGSVCIYCPKEKILFSGDTVFSDGVGRTDVPGGDPEALNQSLEKISRLDVKKILPGHGEPVLSDGNKIIVQLAKAGVQPVD